MNITSSVSALPKVGPKYMNLLHNLEIFTVEDLLYHFPFRYDDLSKIKGINELQEGEIATIEATLGPIENIYTRYKKRLTKASAVDYTGEIDLVWFNQHYLKKALQPGKTYYFSGRVGTPGKKPSLVSPEWEEKKSGYQIGEGTIARKNINTGRLVPIYPETRGISSKWLRTRINDVLNRDLAKLGLSEFLPAKLIHDHNLKNIKTALDNIHFPDNEIEAEHARERFAFEELFMELLNVERRKHEWSEKLDGYKMKPHYDELHHFISKLPFELTEGQNNAFGEILEDMMKPLPMNRLLEGDVGTGKTIVAIIASYLAYLNGDKTLYMAPTEILAKQHFDTFEHFLDLVKKDKPKVVLRTSSKKPSEKEQAESDIIIGTHAILFAENGYEKVALVVIDEQHRFGVEQRAKIIDLGRGESHEGVTSEGKSGLSRKGANPDAKKDQKKTANLKVPHLLTMTATPIPRTLALTLYGDLSISALKEHPVNDRKVKTSVIPEKQRSEAYNWIRERREPTFIVCPLIEESEHESMENVKAAEAEYEILKNGVFSDLEVGLLHGRMKSKEKEEVVNNFREGKVKVLVSTPVIEVGIDIPDASVIVIESAERYGLASLHQLRGRVGRRDKQGFCFVFMSNNSRKAFARLKNLERINNGLELAEIDLQYRGHGDIFGTMQHGFKKFKVANLEDLETLEKAKLEAQKYFPDLDTYPELKDKLNTRKGTDKMAPAN